MTTTPRRYSGADDAEELNRTYPCRTCWCEHRCRWLTDGDDIIRTHELHIGEFELVHTEPAPGDDPFDAEPSVMLPNDFMGLVDLADARSAASTLTYLVSLVDKDQRAAARAAEDARTVVVTLMDDLDDRWHWCEEERVLNVRPGGGITELREAVTAGLQFGVLGEFDI